MVAKAVRAFEEAGAHVEEVKLGIKRPQRELSDVWSRLMMPLNLGAFEAVKAAGLDLLGDHRDDFPPEYLRWIEIGENMTLHDLQRDQAIRTEIYDAIQGVFATYDLIVTPTLAAMPVKNRDDGNTVGPSEVNGEAVDPADRLVPDLSGQLHRPSGRLDPGRDGRRPAGRHADHRPALRRRRRAGRERRLRALAALGRYLPDSGRPQALSGPGKPARAAGLSAVAARLSKEIFKKKDRWPVDFGAPVRCEGEGRQSSPPPANPRKENFP